MQLSFVTDSDRGTKPLTTVAEGLERLGQKPVCLQANDQVIVHVVNLALPNGRTCSSTALIFRPTPVSEHAFAAVLSLASQFWATDIATDKRAKYDIHLLHGATVDHGGRAKLRDGSTIRAIEVIPVSLQSPSERDWRILSAFVEARGAEDQCFRGVLEGLEPEIASQVPVLAAERAVDCSRLSGLEVKLLKQDRWAVFLQNTELYVSKEKLAQTLAVFGIRGRRIRKRSG